MREIFRTTQRNQTPGLWMNRIEGYDISTRIKRVFFNVILQFGDYRIGLPDNRLFTHEVAICCAAVSSERTVGIDCIIEI